jgi:hypothetical protein
VLQGVAAHHDQLKAGRSVRSQFLRLAVTSLLTLSTLATLAMSVSAAFVGPGVVAYAVSIGGSRLTATNLNVGRFLVSKFVRLALTALLTLSTLAALAMSASADFVGPGS